MQQNKITILSTGTLDEEEVQNAANKNIDVEVVPFISTAPLPVDELEKHIDPFLSQTASVIFTSGNAVEAVAACLKGSSPVWSIYCIGYKTRMLAEKYFGASAIKLTADNAAMLAEKIAGMSVNEPVIFFCGDQRRQELPDILELSGIIVREIMVYRTIQNPVSLEKKYDGILFFSPSAVQSFFSVNKVLPENILFAIGPTTSKTLQAFTKNKILQPDKPEKEEVLKKVVEYFKK